MCDQSIRRLTPDEIEEHADERYDELYAKLEEEMREEYDRNFSADFPEIGSYKPRGLKVHAAVMQIMDRERKAAEEQRY